MKTRNNTPVHNIKENILALACIMQKDNTAKACTTTVVLTEMKIKLLITLDCMQRVG